MQSTYWAINSVGSECLPYKEEVGGSSPSLPTRNKPTYLVGFIIFAQIKDLMKESDDNPLGIEKQLYTMEEFGAILRNKFRADNYISNTMLAEIFLAQYPVYSCNIKKLENHVSQKSCGCC